jgi:hypothetical protein
MFICAAISMARVPCKLVTGREGSRSPRRQREADPDDELADLPNGVVLDPRCSHCGYFLLHDPPGRSPHRPGPRCLRCLRCRRVANDLLRQ